MVEILVLYYSRSGRTEALANSVAKGAESIDGVTVKLKRVDYATVDDLMSCDAVALGSPNYFSYMAGIMKDFFDKALNIREKVAGKPCVAFTSGGGSSDEALRSLERMISSFRLEKVADGIVSQGEPSEKKLIACKRLGETLAKKCMKELSSNRLDAE